MFYCFVYPESIDRILQEYFDKDMEERVVEIMKCKANGVFYICKSHVCSLYFPSSQDEDGAVQRYERVCGDVLGIVGSDSIVRKFEVRLSRFKSEPVPRDHLGIDFLVGRIFSDSGKRMGNFLIYKDNRAKRVLAEVLKEYKIRETVSTGDMCLDMINLLGKLERI